MEHDVLTKDDFPSTNWLLTQRLGRPSPRHRGSSRCSTALPTKTPSKHFQEGIIEIIEITTKKTPSQATLQAIRFQ